MGFFDGVHIGHAALLEKTKQRALENDCTPSVLSFDIHPDNLVFRKEVKLIGDARSREDLIRSRFGIDDVVFLHFNRELMNMPWEEFAAQITEELSVCWFIVGHDFTFGRKGEGDPQKLQMFCAERGIGCDVIPPVMLDGKIVSSTYIRQLIENGEMEDAARFLGHPHSLCDTIHTGYRLGRKMDAPTINMFFPAGTVVPRYGVYAAKVQLPGGIRYSAVTNVGVRPTVSNDGRVSVESYLLDFEGDLYGVPAMVEFYHFLRPEIKFETMEELSEQIRKDTEATRHYFSEHQ